MKRTVLMTMVVCALLTGLTTSCVVNMGDGKRIEPSEVIVKQEFPMQEFDAVDIDVVANVKFIQSPSGTPRVVLSAPDNYVELFKFAVENGELDVDFSRKNVNIDPQNVDITIYAPTLRSLENSGVANVEIDRLQADRLEVDNSGVGSLFLSGLQVGVLRVECSGVGNVELGGQAEEARLECSGVGNIKGQQLEARSVQATVSGVGGIKCTATESISGEVSGVGSLKYGGTPQKKSLKRTGVGKISEL